MVILKPDVSLQGPSAVRQLAYLLAVERHFDVVAPRLYLVVVPLTDRPRRDLARCRELVHRAGLMQRVAERRRVRIGVLARIVDLDLVAVVDGELRIIRAPGSE